MAILHLSACERSIQFQSLIILSDSPSGKGLF